MFVPDRPTHALSRAKLLRPARDFYTPWPALFVRPVDSVYRERISDPSALTRTIPGSLFGPSGTRCFTKSKSLRAKRTATLAPPLPSQRPRSATRTVLGFPIRPIKNSNAQTRRFPFRSIGNITLRLAENQFRSIGNTALKAAVFKFGLSGTLRAIARWLKSSKNSRPLNDDILECFPSGGAPSLQARSLGFRSIRNSRPQNPLKAFRSIRNNRPQTLRKSIRPIENSFGLSGTKLRMIRNESSDYQERLFGLSGTPSIRRLALSEHLALLTGGLTSLTPLTSLTSPASQSSAPRALTIAMVFSEEGKQTQSRSTPDAHRARRYPQAHSTKVLSQPSLPTQGAL
jgi:hypothetical protein